MTSSTSGTIDDVRDWILTKQEDRSSIGPDEDLIENRLIDSLTFVEFVFVIERASGTEIDVDNVDLADFKNLTAIEKAFFATDDRADGRVA